MVTKGRAFVIGVFILGIAVDGAEAVRLGIGFFTAMTGGTDPASVKAWAVAFALMAGWTLLLAWGLARPIERRGLLHVTIPVIALILAGNLAVVTYFAEGLATRWFRILGGILVLGLFCGAYAVAARIARRP